MISLELLNRVGIEYAHGKYTEILMANQTDFHTGWVVALTIHPSQDYGNYNILPSPKESLY